MIFSVIQMAQALNHHRHLAVTITSSFNKDDTLPGKYCALLLPTQDVWTRGVSVPLQFQGVAPTTTHFCIGGFSLKEPAKPECQWLYVNVKPDTAIDGKTADSKQNFFEDKNYTDYGQNKAVRTDYQIAKKFEPGYIGPAAYKFNPVQGEEVKYEIRVFEMTKENVADSQTNTLKECGTATSIFPFKSKFGEMILAVLVFIAMLL